MSSMEAEAAQVVVEDNGSGGGGVELWYEDIEAPKFVDFTAADHYNPDDRYWFCARVGCDQRHEQEINLDEINKNFILRVMAARSPHLKLRRALTTANSTTTRKCPQTAPSKPSRPRISRFDLLSSVSRKLLHGNDRPLPSAKPITALTPKQPTTKKPAAVIGNALTTPKRAVKPQLFRSARNHRTLEQPAVVSSVQHQQEEQNNRMVAKALVFTSPMKKKKKKILVDTTTTITKDNASVRKICTGMKKLDINGGQRLPPPSSNTNAAFSRKKMGAREVKSRVYDALKSRNCKKGKENDSSSRRRHLQEESQVSISLVVCHGSSSSSSGGESSDMEVDENSNRGSSIDKCSLESSELFEVPIIQDCLDDLRTKLPIQVEQLPPSSDDVGNHGKEEDVTHKDRGTEMNMESEDREKSLKEQKRDVGSGNALTAGDRDEDDDKENASALDLNSSRVQNTEPGRDTIGKSQKGRVNSKEATADVKSGSSKYSKPRPTNPKPFRLRTDERRVLKEANLEKKLLVTPLKEMKSAAVISSGSTSSSSSLQKKKVVSCLKAQERVRRSIQKGLSQRGVTPTEKRQLSVIKETAVTVTKKTAAAPPNLKKKKKSEEEENTNKSSSAGASSDSCSRSVSRGGRIQRPTIIPREPHFHTVSVPKTCCTKKWV